MSAAVEHEDEYDDDLVALLELVWGEGFLSPGGPRAVRGIVGEADLRDRRVLDIGCGVGGVDMVLAREFGARVIGLDIERGLIERASARIEAAGLADRIEVRLTTPGPLPLADASVDVVFGKDSWIHVEDKPAFFAEAFRVLAPGGVLIAGDWTRGPDPYSDDMKYFFELEGLTYHMGTLDEYAAIMRGAGFVDVELEDISEDYRRVAREEHASMSGALRERMIELLGAQGHAHYVENWRMLSVVLDNRELRPARFRAARPA